MNKFIVVEGIDYSGKSTYIEKLKKKYKKEGKSVYVTREPRGIRFGELLAKEVFFNDNLKISSITKAILFISVGWELYNKVLAKKFKKYDIVICDRYIFSTFAYQVFGGDKTINQNQLLTMYTYAMPKNYLPDEVHWVDCSTTEILRRTKIRLPANNYDAKCLKVSYVNKIRKAYKETFKFFTDNTIYFKKRLEWNVIVFEKDEEING